VDDLMKKIKGFANLFGVKPKAISITIKKLKDLDLINVKYIKNENLVKQRSITLTSNAWNQISNNGSSK
jgi:Mn-dependent DtxR family transcriptional regulator